MKYTRIITAEEVRPGEFLFVCSCGFDFRYQGTCRHLSLLLLHASNGECAGCEIGNIALRNTAAFAACRDDKLIKRTPCDWKGILCGMTAVTLLKNLFEIAHVTMVTTTKTTKTTTMTMTTMTFMNNEAVVAKFQKRPNGNKCVMRN
jgi:hypothetical protein